MFSVFPPFTLLRIRSREARANVLAPSADIVDELGALSSERFRANPLCFVAVQHEDFHQDAKRAPFGLSSPRIHLALQNPLEITATIVSRQKILRHVVTNGLNLNTTSQIRFDMTFLRTLLPFV